MRCLLRAHILQSDDIKINLLSSNKTTTTTVNAMTSSEAVRWECDNKGQHES